MSRVTAKAPHIKLAELTASQAEQRNRIRSAAEKMHAQSQTTLAFDMMLEAMKVMQDDNTRLTIKLREAIRARFGRSTEKLSAEQMGQLVLALGGTPEEAAQPNPNVPNPADKDALDLDDEGGEENNKLRSPKKRKQKRTPRKKTTISPDVAQSIINLTVAPKDRNCIHCGVEMMVIDHIDHTRLEFYPARFELVTRRCEKIACKKCGQDITSADNISPEAARQTAEKQNRDAINAASAARQAAENLADSSDKIVPATASVSEVSAPAARAPQPTVARPAPAAVACETMRPDKCTPDAVAPQSTTDQPFEVPEPSKHSPSTRAPTKRRVGVGFLAHLIEAKCGDALPINRQREQFKRYGVDIPLNTLYGYTRAALQIMTPIAQMILSCVLGADIVGVDDTRLDYLIPAEKSRIKRGHLWCFVSPGALAAFCFTENWSAAQIAPYLRSIDGFVQCDDYAGYASKIVIAEDDGPLVDPEKRLGCLMHIRRRYHRALKSGEADAIIVIGHIKAIYEIEAKATENGLSAGQRHTLRQTESLAHLQTIHDWNDVHQGSLRPSSYLAEAVRYAQNQRCFLDRCFTDGRFAIDNGSCERQIRKPAIGRKNFLFSGSADAAELLAVGYTIIASCHNLGIATQTYLTDVMTRLEGGFSLDNIRSLRPDLWAIERGLLPPGDYLHEKVAK